MDTKSFQTILSRHPRIAIVGGPKTGKTTLSTSVNDRPVYHTDESREIPWEDQSQYWVDKIKEPSFVLEGVQAARALRKGLQVDAIVHLEEPHQNLSKGQQSMAKGHEKILSDVISKNPHLPLYK